MIRNPAPDRRPAILTVAGSDSGGGAGIQADLKTIEGMGGFGTSVVTSVTAQHTQAVESTHTLPTEEVSAQFDAVTSDFDIHAVKTGMLATTSIIETVANRIRDVDAPLVVDPVMVATSGDRLLDSDVESAYETLIKEATLVTPNTSEAKVLTGIEPINASSMRDAGQAIIEKGADAALIKGGHVPGEQVVDVLVTENSETVFAHPRIETEATHGSGCTLSSAIATRLGQGLQLAEAVEEGCAFIERAVRYPLDVGEGPGTVHHLVDLRNRAARADTIETVAEVVDQLVEADVSPLVPEVGLQVVGAPPYAETPHELPAVEGRITRTVSGVRPTRGVRCGASSHIARFLLAAREHEPTIRFALNCRFDTDVERALKEQGWEIVEFDRENEGTASEENNTMQWGASRAVERADTTPVAVIDRGAVGKEPMTRLLASDSDTLVNGITSISVKLEG